MVAEAYRRHFVITLQGIFKGITKESMGTKLLTATNGAIFVELCYHFAFNHRVCTHYKWDITTRKVIEYSQ